MARQALSIHGAPGTGKTSRQMRLISDFKEAGFDASQIAFLSHTKAAANEALSRLNVTRSDLISTIHSQCYRICGMGNSQLVDFKRLKEFSEVIGIPIKNGDIESEEGIEVGDEYLGIMNKARNRMTSADEEYADSHHPGSMPEFELFVEGYNDWKKSNGFIDFTDMLERVVQMGDRVNFNAPVLLIDEAQDLSNLQWAVVRLLAKNSDHLCISGDGDQALYSWGGSDPKGIQIFEEEYNAKRIILPQSYRVPASVHRVALGIINQIKDRVQKTYRPRAEEGIVARHGYIHTCAPKHGQDVLFLGRAGSHKKEIEKFLNEEKIPYITNGGKPGPYQTKIAKAIRFYGQLQKGAELSNTDYQLLADQAVFKMRDSVRSRDLKNFLSVGYMRALSIPAWSYEFYRDGFDPELIPTIRVGTIHSSKGQEADVVYLNLGLTARIIEGQNKDQAGFDDEQRVMYVATTRARHELHLIDAERGFQIDEFYMG